MGVFVGIDGLKYAAVLLVTLLGGAILGCKSSVLTEKSSIATASVYHDIISKESMQAADAAPGEVVDAPAAEISTVISYSLQSPTMIVPVVNQAELSGPFQYMGLDEAILIALRDTRILRSLSAGIVRNPNALASELDAELQRSDAVFGEQAAIAQFDPLWSAGASYANNDNYFNNPVTSGNAAEVQQGLMRASAGISKVNQYGTQLGLANVLTHDSTTNPAVLFPHAWDNRWEATLRQPLFQGRGTRFNQIAGPNGRPGFFGTTGILISRTNHEIAFADFERSLRDFVLEVVNAYWQLDVAYRDYETIKLFRDSSFETWQAAKAKYDQELRGGEADREAQARGQLLMFEQQLDQALNGFHGNGEPGVLQAEANLRRLLLLPLSNEGLIRPSVGPNTADIQLNWDALSQQALTYRAELKQQQVRIHQANLTLEAAKNFLLPRVDAIAAYRLSGQGDDLINDQGKFAGALNEVWEGHYQDWEFGLDMNVPRGRRQAKTGVRNAHLRVTKEHLVFKELQTQILHDLGSVYRVIEQSRRNIELAQLRLDAARDTYQARVAAHEADAVTFDIMLDAQQKFLQARLDLHNALTEREKAIYRLYSEAGTLLNQFSVTPLENSEEIASLSEMDHR